MTRTHALVPPPVLPRQPLQGEVPVGGVRSDLKQAVRAATRTRWVLILVIGIVVIVGYYLAPRGGVAQAVIVCAVGASAAVVVLRTARHTSGQMRLVWLSLGGAVTLSTLADVPYYATPLLTGTFAPFPSFIDALWLGTYPLYVVALLTMARHDRLRDRAGELVDMLIVVIGGASAMWIFIISPVVHSNNLELLAHLVAVTYPAMDLLVFVMLICLFIGSYRNDATRLLVASFVALLTADSLYAIELADGRYHFGGPTDGIWMLSYVLIGAAALHPTAGVFPEANARLQYRLTYGRLSLLAASALAGTLLLATHRDSTLFLGTASVASFVLVMARMAGLNRGLSFASKEVEASTDKLRHQALHDALTGLPNRVLVADRLEQMLARSVRHGTRCALLYMDLDGFKNVNDTLGHAVGDQLLQAVADRLTTALRDVDTIARMGGDEFVILIDGASMISAPELVAERILEVLRQPFVLGAAQIPISLSASVGIAIEDQNTLGDMLRDADVALYQAKASGKNQFAVFGPQMGEQTRQRYELEFDLRSALTDNQYRLLYQPIYNLDDLVMIGVEALIRWDHPTRGRIQPDAFIPLLESTGQIVEVGRWVLREACTQMAKWRAAGSNLTVSVNVSGRQLDHDAILEYVREALTTSGLDPEALTLEVTETALMQNVDATADRLHQLKALGVQIAIDDFGTGYSSLAYLQRFPVDCLKIDRSFTAAIARSPESDALIHTLVQLGRDLGLRTLAEGVETTDQLDHLRRQNVNDIQGFLLAKPLDVATLDQLLNTTPLATPQPARSIR